ncbi:ankyrin repeat protein [Aspergillus sclerotialis]|uniref:Ankyrin repeat protein n=1 Tax=Aspergillus sclerotialis TaxID=2070753 RepID=A0A3A2ZV11_9EURO|nr:ankyrin repeat protein [Aspergillus sclerotialis]
MADPVSIAGLILQAIEAASAIYKYGKQVKSANSEVSNLLGELFALKAILEQMRKDQLDSQAYKSESFRGALDKANTVLKEILGELEKRKLRGKSFWKQLGWPERRVKMQENIDQLERLKTYFILIVMNDNTAVDRDMSASLNVLTDLGKQAKRNSQKDVQQRICQWICPVDVELLHRRARSVCQTGTGSWLIDGLFQQWLLAENKCQLLYLEGKSGSGKTVLCSTAIEATKASNYMNSTAVLFFYCSFQLGTSQELTNVFGAFVAQLSDSFPEILDEIQDDFEKRRPPPPENLIQILVEYAQRRKKLFIFVDAVNESSESEDILRALLALMKSSDKIQVMVTSTVPPIKEQGVGILRAQMRSSSNQHDIQAFVDSQLKQRPTLRRFRHMYKGI